MADAALHEAADAALRPALHHALHATTHAPRHMPTRMLLPGGTSRPAQTATATRMRERKLTAIPILDMGRKRRGEAHVNADPSKAGTSAVIDADRDTRADGDVKAASEACEKLARYADHVRHAGANRLAPTYEEG